MGPLDYIINQDGTTTMFDPDTGQVWMAVDLATPTPVTVTTVEGDTEESILRSQLEHQKDQNKALQDEIVRLTNQVNRDLNAFQRIDKAIDIIYKRGNAQTRAELMLLKKFIHPLMHQVD